MSHAYHSAIVLKPIALIVDEHFEKILASLPLFP